MNTRKRVAAWEDVIFGPSPAASVASAPRVPSRCLDGVFTGTIQDGDGLRVHIARPLTLSRDSDGSWLAYSGEHAGSVAVCDPLACDALDAVFELAANPDGVGSVTIREPEDD